jgi:hypothetical protein
MTDTGATSDDLLRRAKAGDAAALGALFAHYRDRLRMMVRLRLDRRVAGRHRPLLLVDPHDHRISFRPQAHEQLAADLERGRSVRGALLGTRQGEREFAHRLPGDTPCSAFASAIPFHD